MSGLIQTITPVLLILAVFSAQFVREGAILKSSGSQMTDMELLVGTYTGKGSKGIYLLDFDLKTGQLSNERLLVETDNPSFLTYDQGRQFVYAVNEGQRGQVSSYKWNASHSALIPVSQQSSEGSSPCHLELNDRENLLAVANYSSGNLSIYQVNNIGEILAEPTIFQHMGSGPVKPNQDGARAHCVKFGPNGKFLYAVDLGIDQIISYPVHEDGVGEQVSSLRLDPGDGPRHFIFHPTLDLAFVVNELGSSVVSMQIDHSTGKLTRIDKVSTLPDGFSDRNYCADIHMTNDGRYLYASNRGHHSIAIFEVSPDGKLNRIGIEPVRGEWPRNFTLSPDEKYLLVANQNTDNITVFRIDPDSGLLSYTDHEYKLSRPVALKF